MIFIKDYFISIDGGGSKTEICIFNLKTKHMQIQFFDGININQIGETVFTTRICEIFDCLPLNSDYYICIGAPGYGEASGTDRKINSVIEKFLRNEQYIIMNDVELAHYASFGLSDGILLLSGTGSMALSKVDGNIRRAGGWGFLIGDEGSAFSIGLKAVNHLSHVFDGIEQPSILSKLICNTHNFDFSSKLIGFVYSSTNYRKEIAFIARLVDEAANDGCEVAKSILRYEGRQLVKLVKVLNIDNNLPVSYAGSVFNSKVIKSFIEEEGCFKFRKPALKPVLGGIVKAMNVHSVSVGETTLQELNNIYDALQ